MARYFVDLLSSDHIQAEACRIKQHLADHHHSRKAFNSPPHITLQLSFEWSRPMLNAEASADFIPIELANGLSNFVDSQPPIPIQLLTVSQQVSLEAQNHPTTSGSKLLLRKCC